MRKFVHKTTENTRKTNVWFEKNKELVYMAGYEAILQVCDPKLLPQEIQNENNALNSGSFHLLLEKGSPNNPQVTRQ